jgi:hypothetical protein
LRRPAKAAVLDHGGQGIELAGIQHVFVKYKLSEAVLIELGLNHDA